MILHAYGDSWTEGEGCNLNEEFKLKNQDLIIFRNQHSWVKLLGNKLGLNWINNGKSGNPNAIIFNQIIDDVTNGRVKRDDFVIVLWSSSLRDYAAFLPRQQWVSWSVKHLINLPEKFINSYKSNNSNYDVFLSEYKSFFLNQMFNQNYYNIVNQNYIIYLQKMLESYNVKHLMVDAFEVMVQSVNKIDDKTNLINKKNYFHFGKKTARDILQENKSLNVWEGPLNSKNEPEVWYHPNKRGYELIGEKIYEQIKQIV